MAKGKTPARCRPSESKQTSNQTLSVSGEEAFAIGDFVWAKTKSYPWWPGKVYDASLATADIVKLRRDKHCALVDYFGSDGRCAWCEPDQLKLFEAEFSRLMAQHSRPSFLHAVGEALEEIGRVLEKDLTCRCSSPRRSKAEPKTRIRNYSPADFLRRLRCAAADASAADLLQATMLQSWVTAFQKLSFSSHSGRRLTTAHLTKLVTTPRRPTKFYQRIETTKILSELRSIAVNPLRRRRNLLGKTVRDFFVRYRRSISDTDSSQNCLHLRYLEDSDIAETQRSNGKRKGAPLSSKGIADHDLTPLRLICDLDGPGPSCQGRAAEGERVWMGEASLDDWTPFIFKITDRSKEGGYLNTLSKGKVAALVGCSEPGRKKRIKDGPCPGTLINNAGSQSSNNTEGGNNGNNGQMMMDTDNNESASEDPTALFLSFDSSVPVPSTDDVISTFSKFGDLIEVETLSLSEGGCARISFVSSIAAERAFNNRDKIGGFSSLVMSYHLCR